MAIDKKYHQREKQIEDIKSDIKYLFSRINWTHCYMDSKSTDIVGTIFNSLDKLKIK